MEVTLVGASWDLVAGVGEKKQKKNSKPTQSTPTNLPQKEQILWARHTKGEGGGGEASSGKGGGAEGCCIACIVYSDV